MLLPQTHFYKKLGAITLSALMSSSALAAGPQCRDLFAAAKKEVQAEVKLALGSKAISKSQRNLLEKQIIQNYLSNNIEAYKTLKISLENQPHLKSQVSLVNAMENLIVREDLSTFHGVLNSALVKLNTAEKNLTEKQVSDKFKSILTTEISKFMAKADAKEKIKSLNKVDITVEDLMQALGKMTSVESLHALIGKNGISNIDADSLVGRYLAKSKKAGVNVQSLVGSFQKGPGYKGRGQDKLYVSVDGKTAKILNTIIGANPHLLFHKHESGQGTLEMHFENKDLTYSGSNQDYSDLIEKNYYESINQNTIMPVVVLSGIEASNVKNYFELGSLEQKYAKYPWGLVETVKGKDENGVQLSENYCAHGGYTSCTHWIGEMPIGESKVTQYTFPGNPEADYTDNTYDHLYENPKKLRTKDLGTYNKFKSKVDWEGKVQFTTIRNSTRTDRLLRMVWKETQGHEQLWSVVGDNGGKALAKGEWANPGWVVYSFMTRTTQDRVPVVFITREDASQPLTTESLDALKADISQY